MGLDQESNSSSDGSEKTFNLREEAESFIENNENSETTVDEKSKEGQVDESQNQELDESKNGSLSDVLKQLEKNDEDLNKEKAEALFEKANLLGAIDDGEAIQIKSDDELKELIQKGHNYTKKTMAHAEAVKKFAEESAKAESDWIAQNNQIIRNDRLMKNVFTRIEKEDPELFSLIEEHFLRDHELMLKEDQHLSKVEGKFSELNKEIESLKNEKIQEKHKSVRDGWEKELSSLQTTYGPMFKKAGIIPDWKGVEKLWSANADGTLTGEAALHARYFKELSASINSEKKNLETKNKTLNNVLKKTGASGGTSGKEADKQFKVGDYASILRG